MGIRILEGDYDRSRSGAVLIDSVTERPMTLPLFDCSDAAEDFEAFARDEAKQDIRSIEPRRLDELHTQWLRQVCTACWTRDCDCAGCGSRCHVGCPTNCPEARP